MNHRKYTAVIFSVLSLVLALSLLAAGTFAWFSRQKAMHVVSRVVAPNAYYLKGPKGITSEPLFVPRIDLMDEDKSQEQFFFSVVGKGNYKIQIGHTTNVPYQYSLYRIRPSETTAELLCEYAGEELNFTYWTDPPVNLLTVVLNDNDSDNLANNGDRYYQSTYEGTDNVQKNARPIYRQTGVECSNEDDPDDTGYFLLVIDWADLERSAYSEESDIICIVAGKTDS